MKSRKEHIDVKKNCLVDRMNVLSDVMIAKQKKLYKILEDMVNNTYNHDMFIDFE